MRRVLLTGMSGTGKSSVIGELRKQGFTAIDMDEPGWSVHDTQGHQLWCEDRLREVLAANDTGHLSVSGCAENQVKFYPQFNFIILMSAPADVIKERLARRTNNPYGKRPGELAEVLHYVERVEPLLRRSATHEIDTTIPLDRVVAEVLSLGVCRENSDIRSRPKRYAETVGCELQVRFIRSCRAQQTIQAERHASASLQRRGGLTRALGSTRRISHD